jgi:hypothetical protein
VRAKGETVVNERIAARRLANQRITQRGPRDPADIVAWFGAVQAQLYPAAKWALALRMPEGATDARIERALDEGRILRTHVMRPTWHFVAASDLHWMLELTAPRVHRALAFATRYYGLEPPTRLRATALFERALRDGQYLTRAELGAQLGRAGLTVKGIRLALLTMHAELERVICSGPQRGKQSTYALLAERAPRPTRRSRDEALAELTERYFRSHGPATVRDFVWWSGLTTADAKRGLDMSGGRHQVIDGYTYWSLNRPTTRETRRAFVHLLPIYDEYLVAYRDLDAVPRRAGSRGALEQALIVGGQVAGTWKTARKADGLVVEVVAARRLSAAERHAVAEEAARYGSFLETRVSLAFSRS